MRFVSIRLKTRDMAMLLKLECGQVRGGYVARAVSCRYAAAPASGTVLASRRWRWRVAGGASVALGLLFAAFRREAARVGSGWSMIAAPAAISGGIRC